MKKIFGIIGDPVKHSLSPLLHNYWFKKYKVNATPTLIINEKKFDKSLNYKNLKKIIEKNL